MIDDIPNTIANGGWRKVRYILFSGEARVFGHIIKKRFESKVFIRPIKRT